MKLPYPMVRVAGVGKLGYLSRIGSIGSMPC
jgi:hypothetical protein